MSSYCEIPACVWQIHCFFFVKSTKTLCNNHSISSHTNYYYQLKMKDVCVCLFVCEHSANRNENATEILVRDLHLSLSRV